jgi:hypothetical protein
MSAVSSMKPLLAVVSLMGLAFLGLAFLRGLTGCEFVCNSSD